MREPVLQRILFVLLLVAACSRNSSGPFPIAYDKEACAHCHMLIGDPRFAAQLVTTDGTVIGFDDPGCLLLYMAERKPSVRASWVRDSQRDRWLPLAEARFVRVPWSPMGFGVAAVDAGTPGSLSIDEARAEVVRNARAQQ
jgi:copper chaperone NosL